MALDSPADLIQVSVAYSPGAGEVEEVNLSLPSAATVADALARSGLLKRHPGIDLSVQRLGIWGRLAALDDPLRARDRVEIYRPLAVDPKEARRLRYQQHRERHGKAK